MADAPNDTASDIYEIEEFRLPLITYWASTILSLVVAIVTLGGGSTPVVRSGYRIRRTSTGDTVGEISDSMTSDVDTGALLRSDLGRLTAAAFDERWL